MKRAYILLSISGLLLMLRTAEAQTADTLQETRPASSCRSTIRTVTAAGDSLSGTWAAPADTDTAPSPETP